MVKRLLILPFPPFGTVYWNNLIIPHEWPKLKLSMPIIVGENVVLPSAQLNTVSTAPLVEQLLSTSITATGQSTSLTLGSRWVKGSTLRLLKQWLGGWVVV
eukprot:Lithocolla_globosa_v1_NODE_438_length_4052_cov_8.871404.p3 type:complete len:101 gc:universal NODE_438_length_4052_cov_8.871404:1167-865(-)